MGDKYDGGTAFPQSGFHDPNNGNYVSEDNGGKGMSLRDYFAAKAMQSDWAAPVGMSAVAVVKSFDKAAEIYYKMADAMLAEMKRRHEQ